MPNNPHTFSYSVPDFHMPLASRGLNQYTQDAGVDTLQWLESNELLTDAMRAHVVRTRPEITAGYYYPVCDRKSIYLGTRYMAITFLIDDIFDDAITERAPADVARAVEELADATWGRRRPGMSAVARAWAELIDELNGSMSPGWVAAFARDNECWIRAYAQESRLAKTGMSLSEYMPLRMCSFASLAFFHLEERLNGIDLRTEIRELPAMRSLREISSQWGGLHNDVWSAEKEAATGYPHNAVLIVQRHRGVSLNAAVATVNSILTGLMKQYLSAAEAARSQLAYECLAPSELETGTALVEHYHAMTRAYHDYYYDPRIRRYHPEDYMPRGSQRPLHAGDEIITGPR